MIADPRRWLDKTRFGVGISSLVGLSTCTWLAVWALLIPLFLGWSPVAVFSGSMGPAIDTGDIVVAEPHDGEGLDPGAVIVFDDPAGEGRITHRIVDLAPSGDYVTRGDANGRIDSTPVPAESVDGVGRILIPFVGKPFVWATNGQWRSLLLAALVLVFALWTSRWGLLDRFDPWRASPPAPVVFASSDGTTTAVRSSAWTMSVVALAFLMLVSVVTGVGSDAAYAGSTVGSGNSWTGDDLEPATGLNAAGGTTVSLDWTATPDAYAAGHRVFRSTSSGGPYAQIAEVTPASTTSYVDSAAPGTYYYVVRAFYLGWESVDSNEAGATVAPNVTLVSLDGGAGQSCGSQGDGSVWCWGRNDKGQIGNGVAGADEDLPVQVVAVGGVGLLADAAQVVTGAEHGCSVHDDESVSCWGRGDNGRLGDGSIAESGSPIQTTGPGGIGVLTDVAVSASGKSHTCAVKTDATVWCWGRNNDGQLGDNTLIDSYPPVQVVGPGGVGVLADAATITSGESHSCVVKTDATVWCWGRNDRGQLGDNTTTGSPTPVQVVGPGGVGVLTDASAIVAGLKHTCVVKTDNTVWCWGLNDKGQLGDNTTTDTSAPVQVVGPGGVGVLSGIVIAGAGASHTCAAKNDDTVWCWGLNVDAQLGDNTTTDSASPVQSRGFGFASVDLTSLASGLGHTCGVRVDASVWCWGRNDKGQVGIGTAGPDQDIAAQVVGPGGVGVFADAATLAAGSSHSCAVKTDNTVWCWGHNDQNQLGDNTTTDTPAPVQVVGPGGIGVLTGAAAPAAGEKHTCVVKTDATVWCWGRNDQGQLGDNTTTNSATPVQVVGPGGIGVLTDAATITAGLKHTCVVKTDNTTWCWGDNDQGQLGDNTGADTPAPVQVVGPGGIGVLTGAATPTAGEKHTCVVKTDTTAWCWGRNDRGQLGDNTTTNSPTPVQVVGPGGIGVLTGAATPTAGLKHTCVTKTDATAWCWGHNDKGQLGDNTTTDAPAPVQVVGPDGIGLLTGITTAATGNSHTCATRSDATVWCWGLNADAQIGNNTTTDRANPGQTIGFGIVSVQITSLVGGQGHTCGVRVDASVWCWGRNDKGQVGIGTSGPDQDIAAQVVGPGGVGVLADAANLAAGSGHTCAVKTDNTAWCWGHNDKGQLGDNTTTDRPAPVQVVGEDGIGVLTDAATISAGDKHTCVVKTDATSWCWGVNDFGQLARLTRSDSSAPLQVVGPDAVGVLTGAATAGAGATHTCVVKTDATTWCWGRNDRGQLGDNTLVDSSAPVQVVGPGGVGVLTGAATVTAGLEHTCVVKTDATVWCWGRNDQDQLGDNTGSDSAAPVQVVGPGGVGVLTDAATAAAGEKHTCVVKTDATVWCWGRNDRGQLGDNTTTGSPAPVQVVGPGGVGVLTGASGIVAGLKHTCVVKTDNTVWCWGLNDKGQLGDNTTTDTSAPVQVVGPGGVGVLSGIVIAGAGASHTCAAKNDDTVWCWGLNSDAQLGDNTTTDSATPVAAFGFAYVPPQVVSLVGGLGHTCGAGADASVWCWGRNDKGQVGIGTAGPDQDIAAQVVGPGGVGVFADAATLAAGSSHSCAVKTDNTVWCWGHNDQNQLGDNTTTDTPAPVQVVGPGGIGVLTGAAAPAAGEKHTCVVKTDATVWCWGRNDQGQLGDNTTTNSATPVQVVGPGGIGVLTDAATITAGLKHTCVVKTDNTTWCWGDNDQGQLGDNTGADTPAPVQVVGPGGIGVLTGAATPTAGEKHTCVVKTDATAWCWGRNDRGQLGDNTTTNSPTPVQVVGPGGIGVLVDAATPTAGLKHTCVTKTDATAWCWGHNDKGQLGDNTTTDAPAPVQVVGPDGIGLLTGITTAATGNSHTCATRSDATVWCWGLNADAQIGNNTTTDRANPGQTIGV